MQFLHFCIKQMRVEWPTDFFFRLKIKVEQLLKLLIDWSDWFRTRFRQVKLSIVVVVFTCCFLISSHSIHVRVRRRTERGLFDDFDRRNLLNLLHLFMVWKFILDFLNLFDNLRCNDWGWTFRRVVRHWLVTRRANSLWLSFTQDLIRIVLLLFSDWILNGPLVVFLEPGRALHGILSKGARDWCRRTFKIVNHLVDVVVWVGSLVLALTFNILYAFLPVLLGRINCLRHVVQTAWEWPIKVFWLRVQLRTCFGISFWVLNHSLTLMMLYLYSITLVMLLGHRSWSHLNLVFGFFGGHVRVIRVMKLIVHRLSWVTWMTWLTWVMSLGIVLMVVLSVVEGGIMWRIIRGIPKWHHLRLRVGIVILWHTPTRWHSLRHSTVIHWELLRIVLHGVLHLVLICGREFNPAAIVVPHWRVMLTIVRLDWNSFTAALFLITLASQRLFWFLRWRSSLFRNWPFSWSCSL